MERLNATKRKELLEDLNVFWKELHMIYLLEETYISTNPFNIAAEELIFRKYRFAVCLKILQKHGFTDGFKNANLPDVSEIYQDLKFTKYEDVCERYEAAEELIEEFEWLGRSYLFNILENTGWKIYRCSDITDYEHLPKNIIKKLSDTIEDHWGMMIGANNDYYGHEYFHTESGVLEQIGLGPDKDEMKYTSVYPSENIIFANESIEKMLYICREERYREWEEFKELQEISEFHIFDYAWKLYNISGLKDREWCCINYLFGETSDGMYEKITPYLLTYEAVIFMLLADMIAKDFLDHYEKQKGAAI